MSSEQEKQKHRSITKGLVELVAQAFQLQTDKEAGGDARPTNSSQLTD